MLYTRPTSIEEKLKEIIVLERKEIASRCGVQDKEDPKYIPSECLVYLVREHRTRSMDYCSEALYKALLERVMRGLPSGESIDGEKVNAFKSNIGDLARERFLKMLMKDRIEYVEGLDIYEARFAKGLKSLRIDAERKVTREEKPFERMEMVKDSDTSEYTREVEEAAGSFDPYDSNKLDDPDFVSRLYEAIDELPHLQKAIIEMDRNGIPTESKEAGQINISTVLGKTPKTIRTHRDMAHLALRAALTKE